MKNISKIRKSIENRINQSINQSIKDGSKKKLEIHLKVQLFRPVRIMNPLLTDPLETQSKNFVSGEENTIRTIIPTRKQRSILEKFSIVF